MPLVELATAIFFSKTATYPNFEFRHATIALIGLCTVLAVIRFTRRCNEPFVPVFVALSLMMPQFYGHSFINSKDIPLACAFTWQQVALCNFLTSRKKSPGSR